MKVNKRLFGGSKFWISCAVLCAASISHSVHPQTNADPKKIAATATNPPPPSVFTVPRSAQEGMRDPFFPKSNRIFANATPAPITTTVPSTVVHAELKLQGISGPPNHRLPIINGRTFEVGEEAEVNTPSGRVAVRCIEIKGDTVIVQALGERRELKLRTGL